MGMSGSSQVGIKTGVCTSTTRPTSPYAGQQIYESDTKLILMWNGTSWVLPFAQKFQRATASGSTSYISIASIPQYGTNMWFRGLFRSTRPTLSNTGGRFAFNGLYGAADYAGVTQSGSTYSAGFGYMGQVPAAGGTYGDFAAFECFVPSYSANMGFSRKTVSAVTSSTSGGTQQVGTIVGGTSGIGSVTSIDIMDDVWNNLHAGSFVEIWIGP